MAHEITLNKEDIFATCYHRVAGESCLDVSEHALVYVARGSVEIDVDDKHICTINEGECVFVRKDHRTNLLQNISDNLGYHLSIVLFFPRNILFDFYKTLREEDLPKKSVTKSKSISKINTSPEVRSLFDSFKPYYEANIRPGNGWLKIRVYEAVKLVLQNDESAYASLFDFTTRWRLDIMDFMEKNYMYDLSVEQLAHYTGRSVATFKRDFAKISDVSPRNWIIRRRLFAAHYMIMSSHKPINMIMKIVGFKNFSHFSRVYKAQFGFSPTDTRTMNPEANVLRK